MEESRLAQKPPGKEKKKKQMDLPLLTTNGFSTLALIFHPYYQGSFEFDRIEDVAVNGKESAQVRFRHIPGTRSTAALFLKGKDYPLDLQGTAWIDLESGKIIKIAAGLMSPLPGSQSADSEFQCELWARTLPLFIGGVLAAIAGIRRCGDPIPALAQHPSI